MKKQNWLYKLISRLCNRRKKETFPTVNLPYDELKKYIHTVNIKIYVPSNEDKLIKCRLSNRIADYIVECINVYITIYIYFFSFFYIKTDIRI